MKKEVLSHILEHAMIDPTQPPSHPGGEQDLHGSVWYLIDDSGSRFTISILMNTITISIEHASEELVRIGGIDLIGRVGSIVVASADFYLVPSTTETSDQALVEHFVAFFRNLHAPETRTVDRGTVAEMDEILQCLANLFETRITVYRFRTNQASIYVDWYGTKETDTGRLASTLAELIARYFSPDGSSPPNRLTSASERSGYHIGYQPKPIENAHDRLRAIQTLHEFLEANTHALGLGGGKLAEFRNLLGLA